MRHYSKKSVSFPNQNASDAEKASPEVDKDFENDMKIYLSSLSKLYDSVFYNKERIINTNGIEEFNFLTKSVKLSISFRHKPQGFGNLNTKLLIGNEKMIYY